MPADNLYLILQIARKKKNRWKNERQKGKKCRAV